MKTGIQSWKGKLLSKVGKEVLIKTVARALPNYAMSVFFIPLGMCTEMEGLMSKYWWQSSSKQKRRIP